MLDKLPTLAHLIKQLQQVPYVASKHIYRIAHHFLEMDNERLEQFCSVLKAAHEKLAKCTTCFVWRERTSECMFCASTKRTKKIICVVETWYDLWSIERTGSYQGVYHVLGGAICPLDGIGPEDLTIKDLRLRVATGECEEIILALNQTPEGEATSAYIAKKLQGVMMSDGVTPVSVKITCLARGIPVGSTLEMMDRLTVHKAISERRLF